MFLHINCRFQLIFADPEATCIYLSSAALKLNQTADQIGLPNSNLGLDHNFGHSLIPAKADIHKWLLDSGFRRNDDPLENALPLQYGRRNDQAPNLLDLKGPQLENSSQGFNQCQASSPSSPL